MAVYTKLSKTDISCILKNYDLGTLVSYKGIESGVQNTNYILETDQTKLILTIFEENADWDDLPFFIGLMEQYEKQDVPCPRVYANHNGEQCFKAYNKPAFLATFLDGKSHLEPTADDCAQLGDVLGRMHTATMSCDLVRKNPRSYQKFKSMADPIRHRAYKIEPDLWENIETEISFLENNWPQNLRTGIIHTDLFTDNVFFTDHKLSAVLDLYDSCTDYYLYDLAITMNAWCFDPDHSFNQDKAKTFLENYLKHHPEMKGELTHFPIIARGAAMRFLLSRAKDWLFPDPLADILIQKDPIEYLDKLRFHQSIKTFGDYGI